jgi:hypothetical protein
MTLSLPAGAYSICFTCKHWEWAIEIKGKNETSWINECNKDYISSDHVKFCEGYEKVE